MKNEILLIFTFFMIFGCNSQNKATIESYYSSSNIDFTVPEQFVFISNLNGNGDGPNIALSIYLKSKFGSDWQANHNSYDYAIAKFHPYKRDVLLELDEGTVLGMIITAGPCNDVTGGFLTSANVEVAGHRYLLNGPLVKTRGNTGLVASTIAYDSPPAE